MTLYESIITRESRTDKNKEILSAYDKILQDDLKEMKRTFLQAVEILFKGDEDRAWAVAQKDQGLKKGATKREWITFAKKSQAYKKLMKEEEEKEYINESYTDKIKGINKKAFDYFKKYQKALDVKKLGFKGFNVTKASITMSSLSDKQRATMLQNIMGDKFDHAKAARELEKMIPKLQAKWKDIQKEAHLKLYGEEPSFGSYKVSGVGDSDYDENYKKQLRTLAHMETAFKYALEGHKKVKKL